MLINFMYLKIITIIQFVRYKTLQIITLHLFVLQIPPLHMYIILFFSSLHTKY